MTAALTANLVVALLVSLALGWAGYKRASWGLWTAAEAALLVVRLVTGGGLFDVLIDAGGTLLGAVVLVDLQRKARA